MDLHRYCRTRSRGYTLVEVLVVMGIFLVVLVITSTAFQRILATGTQQLRSAETQTEGLVGLELFRSDVEHAGFGIPWTIPSPPAGGYDEFHVGSTGPVTGITSSNFNEAPPSAIRVAYAPTGGMIRTGSSNTNPGSAYLVIKSNRVAMSQAGTEKKWTYIPYVSSGGSNTSTLDAWPNAEDNLGQNGRHERVTSIVSTYNSSGAPDRVLLMNGNEFFYSVPGPPPVQPPNDAYKPADGSQVVVVYGVDTSNDLRMPYNRADYYIKKPSAADTNQIPFPQSCNPGTGILIKGVVQHATGTFANAEYPLLNCAGDMQVEFEMDTGNDGNISCRPNLDGLTAADIRNQVKTVRVYILAHEGKKDPSYTYSGGNIQVGDPSRPSSSGKTWSVSDSCSGDACMKNVFGTDWKNYRWKVYTIAVRLKNI